MVVVQWYVAAAAATAAAVVGAGEMESRRQEAEGRRGFEEYDEGEEKSGGIQGDEECSQED